MKIVHLAGWYFPDSVGGTEIYVDALCRRLMHAGHEVRVAAPLVSADTTATYEHAGVPVFRYSIPARPTREEACHLVPVRGAERLHEWLAAERPDVLHVHSFTTGVGLPEMRVAARLGVRVIVTCHLPGFGYMCRTGELMQWGRSACDGVVSIKKCASCCLTSLGLPGSLSKAVGAMPLMASRMLSAVPGRIGTTLGMAASVDDYRRMQCELFTIAERIVVLNETARCMLIANGHRSDRLVLNRLGVSQTSASNPPERARSPGRPATFGYLGRLHPSKGLTVLMRAVASLPVDVAFTLEIRGPVLDTSSARYVDELLGLVGNNRTTVSFKPAVSASRIPDVLADLDAVVIPSMCYENGPTIALEAMAAGVPIVASAIGNLSEIVQDGVNGRLVPPGDVSALAAVLHEIAIHPRTTIDRWRQHLVSPRTMDEVARDYLALYGA